jgi:bifunctional UDP-N-acetylglucosamine pyrophosphorylase / glucosamine-1-phosphate N-acetyltransferase
VSAPQEPSPGQPAPTSEPATFSAGPQVAAVVVLAAGSGTRMKSTRSKLLHEVAGHSMLSYAVNAATAMQPEHLVVVVGHQRDQVESHLGEIAPHVQTAVQDRARSS